MKTYYAAYGSNLNVRDMKTRCPGARAVGTAVLDGWTLAFRGRPQRVYLTVEPAAGARVPVAVWEVSREDELQLDAYEAYPDLYDKRTVSLAFTEWSTGRTVTRTVFFYTMREGCALGTPTEAYVAACLEGYEDFGFDRQQLLALCPPGAEDV